MKTAVKAGIAAIALITAFVGGMVAGWLMSEPDFDEEYAGW